MSEDFNRRKKKKAKATRPLFFNREASWLQFNRRVLFEAQAARNPLLERLRFLTIYHSNLDEFVMKRVGGHKRLLLTKKFAKTFDAKTLYEQLLMIRKMLHEDQKEIFGIYKQLVKELKQNNVELLTWKELQPTDQEYLHQYFLSKVFPLLTPLSVDPGHPFPFISNLSTSLAVSLQHPADEEEEYLFSRIKIPEFINHWILLPEKISKQKFRFISALELIKAKIDLLFPGMKIIDTMPFRVTRNAELFRSDEDAEDLLELAAEHLKEQKFAEVVRLEHDKNANPWLLDFIKRELPLNDEDIYQVTTPVHFSSLRTILDISMPSLKFKPWNPLIPKLFLEKEQVFKIIKKQDILVHHPYESFKHSVESFIQQAADDPRVRSIKMTLYRTGDKSPFVDALIRAAENGKQVVCLVELKARFDEKRNIRWAQALEEVGVHVVYGLVGQKTHSKIALIVREELNGHFLSYAHIGTGNYHSQTANLYTDLGLFTSDEQLCGELVEVFNYLTGRSLKVNYDHLLVAPLNMKQRFLKLIEQEKLNAESGKPSGIVAKMNSLEDKEVTHALYEASQAGVQVVLIVRGICCLIPQLKGISDNIKVYSILGRFLEHSRFFIFRSGAQSWKDADFYMGSADWMHRNLHDRLEIIAPIYDVKAKAKIWDIVETILADEYLRWELTSLGNYITKQKKNTSQELGTQQVLMQKFRDQNTIF